MYSFKEKNKLYYDLQNADFAQADLNLLSEISPAEQIIERAKRNPQRHCNEVLYRLLDLKTAEEIRLNRRASASDAPVDKGTSPTPAASADEKKAKALAAMAAGRAAAKAKRDAAKVKAASLKSKTEEVEAKTSELEDKELELSEKESELEDKESELEDKEKELQKAEDSLNAEKKSSPLQKELEYPAIRWNQILDKDVQTAILIYNDRINTYRSMKVLDQEFDTHPTDAKVLQMVELRNQNLQCFRELKHYNATGKWLYIHPLIIHQSEYNQLVELRRKDPQEFLRQYVATAGNVKRYTSYIKSPSREDKRKTDRLHLQAHIDRANLFKSILENEDPH